jgi:hypothetical protein
VYFTGGELSGVLLIELDFDSTKEIPLCGRNSAPCIAEDIQLGMDSIENQIKCEQVVAHLLLTFWYLLFWYLWSLASAVITGSLYTTSLDNL